LEKIRTNILCSLTPPPPSRKSCRLSDNVERYGREVQGTDDNTTRRKRIACWTPKATDTLRICNTYCFSTEAVVMRRNLNVTSH